MPEFNINEWLPAWFQPWMIQVFVVVLLTVVANFFQKRIVKKLHVRFEATRAKWDDAVVIALKAPIALVIWAIGIGFAAEIIYIETNASIFKAVDPLRNVLIVISLVWFLLRLTRNVENNYIEQQREEGVVDVTTTRAVGKLIRLSLLITAVLIAMQTLGFSISGVLAFGGVGGIAIGFAARDLLANFFGGLMIYLDRPFAVGDWIRSPDRSIEGTVEDIGWRLTCIRTFDKRPLYIPNSIFTNIVVENPSRMSHRRIYETIGIRYDDIHSLPKIVVDIKQMLIDHDEIDHSQTLIVNFNSFSESSLDFFVYTFTNTTNWIRYHEVKEDVLLKIAGIVESYNAEMAYPTTTMHMPDSVKMVDA